jgi:DNA polymerase theta
VRVRGVQEPAERVAGRYGVEPSAVKALQEAAGKSAGRLAAFCERLGYADQEVLLARFQARARGEQG